MKTRKTTTSSFVLAGFILAGLATSSAVAQQSITQFDLALSQDFDGYAGTAAPSGWTSSTSSFQGRGTGSGTTGGIYSFGTDSTGVDTDRWFGVQFAGAPNAAVTLSTSFRNDTGGVITSLVISYDAYQFRAVQNGRTSFFNVNLNGGAAISGLTFTSNNSLATGQRGTILGVSAFPTTLTATVSGLSIQPDAVFTLNWAGGRGDDTTGSAQGIGINNVSLTAIPETSTYAAIFGVLVLGAAFAYRRRRS
jgi:MYXO-CTERM domain-containing protein